MTNCLEYFIKLLQFVISYFLKNILKHYLYILRNCDHVVVSNLIRVLNSCEFFYKEALGKTAVSCDVLDYCSAHFFIRFRMEETNC